jgi:hypothetical protein
MKRIGLGLNADNHSGVVEGAAFPLPLGWGPLCVQQLAEAYSQSMELRGHAAELMDDERSQLAAVRVAVQEAIADNIAQGKALQRELQMTAAQVRKAEFQASRNLHKLEIARLRQRGPECDGDRTVVGYIFFFCVQILLTSYSTAYVTYMVRWARSLGLYVRVVSNLPLRSLPLRSVPLRSVPLRSLPLRSLPLRSLPLRSLPLRSLPLRSLPLRSLPLRSLPTRAIQNRRLFATITTRAKADLRVATRGLNTNGSQAEKIGRPMVNTYVASHDHRTETIMEIERAKKADAYLSDNIRQTSNDRSDLKLAAARLRGAIHDTSHTKGSDVRIRNFRARNGPGRRLPHHV